MLLYLRVDCFDPNRTTRTWINQHLTNGIQEVDGSIPFGSTNAKNLNSPSVGRRFFFSCANSTIGLYSIPLSFEMSLCCSLGAVSTNS